MRKAAEQGEPRAMHQLGLMSELGLGVPRAPQDAYVWLNVAAARGVTQAETARDRVRGLLSETQLKEAQERSRVLDRRIPAG
jgi:TPR repeat protein